MKRVGALRLAGAAALALGARPAQAADPAFSLAGTANDSGGEMFYAHELGLFAKNGVDLRIAVLNNPGASVAGVVGGTLTFSTLTIPGIAVARQRGVPIVIAAPASIYSSAAPTSGIVVLKDAPYRKAADLNGKTMSIRDIGNMSYYGAKAWVDKNGGDSTTIKWVEINDEGAVGALQAGRIDAASISNPAFDDAIHGTVARLFANCYDAIADHFLIAAYFTTIAFAQSHPDDVRRFCDAVVQAGAWANGHHPESAKLLEKYTQAPVPPTNTRVTYAERVRPADAQPVLDLLTKYGVLKTPMRAGELFAPSLPLVS